MNKKDLGKKVSAVIFGILLFFILLELGLRLGGFIFLSIQEHRNRLAIKQKGTYRIMCLGESTTALGGKYSYPSQLEKILNERDIGVKFSVINKGLPATNTSAIVLRLEENLDKYNPDMVITMMGINDKGSIVAYKNIPNEKAIMFFRELKTYKLARLLWLHIINKAKELGICDVAKEKKGVSLSSMTYFTVFRKISSNCVRKETILEKAIEGRFGTYNMYVELGRRYVAQGKFAEAEEILKKAIDIRPNSYNAYVTLGGCLRVHGKHVEAEEILKKAIEIESDNDRAYFELVWLYRDQEEHIEREKVLKKILEINPGNDRAYIELVWLYKKHGKYKKAEQVLKKAILMNPMNDRAYVELGWLYKNKGKYSEAKEVFNKAIAMFKKEIKVTKEKDKVYGCLGRCYQELGNYKLADAYFEKANNIRFGYYNPKMRHNYHKLKEILANRNIKLVCVQYPMRSVESLRRMFKDKEGIIFVDNEMIFKEAVEKSNYNEYFGDIFAGDFGHCTDKGNKLIATNIADTILRECFDKKFQIID